MNRYYIIAVEGGTEISTEGPYLSASARDSEAKSFWQEMNADKGDNLFRAEVNEKGELSVGHFIGGELE